MLCDPCIMPVIDASKQVNTQARHIIPKDPWIERNIIFGRVFRLMQSIKSRLKLTFEIRIQQNTAPIQQMNAIYSGDTPGLLAISALNTQLIATLINRYIKKHTVPAYELSDHFCFSTGFGFSSSTFSSFLIKGVSSRFVFGLIIGLGQLDNYKFLTT